ncbi:MAG: TIGR03013 family XrtA/PEP-CTERM system glycosyltransferase [Nitrospiraceae bacterium]
MNTLVESRRLANINSKSSSLRKKILILGSGYLAVDLFEILRSKKLALTEVVGLVDGGTNGFERSRQEIVGGYDHLFELVEKYRVRMVVVCLEDRRQVLPVQTLLDLKTMGVDIIDGHTLYEEESGRLSIDFIRPSALIFSTGFQRRLVAMWFKRFVDIICAAAGMFLLFPIFVIIALSIRLDSAGPVFYRQVRVGLQGNPFVIWKFRTMRDDAERNGPRWARVRDSRITRVGRWVRLLRVDEFPQLLNVLKGEMSLVGPRPERPVFVQELRKQIPYYDLRHTIRPGITGWAQVKYRYGASAQDAHVKLQYDLYYVKNLSVVLDIRVLIATVKVVLFGVGAR